MRRVVRAFLVWVMVVALPVQGMAASTMLFCGPGHEHMMPVPVLDAPAVAPGHGGDVVHQAAATGHDGHEHAVASDPVASEARAGTDADDGKGLFPQHGKFSCSACAACCSAMALPASFALPEVTSPALPIGAAPDAPVASHQPDGLERPPRTVLA